MPDARTWWRLSVHRSRFAHSSNIHKISIKIRFALIHSKYTLIHLATTDAQFIAVGQQFSLIDSASDLLVIFGVWQNQAQSTIIWLSLTFVSVVVVGAAKTPQNPQHLVKSKITEIFYSLLLLLILLQNEMNTRACALTSQKNMKKCKNEVARAPHRL